MQVQNVKIEVFLPEEAIEAVRAGIHQAGAGRIGLYDHCVSISDVRGYWRPLEGSRPYRGNPGEIMAGTECKLEVRCPVALAAGAVQAIRRAHPYEEPVINVIPLLDLEG